MGPERRIPRVGDLVLPRDEYFGPQSIDEYGVGTVIAHMPPYAKSLEPDGIVNVLWSASEHYIANLDEWWHSPFELKIISQLDTHT